MLYKFKGPSDSDGETGEGTKSFVSRALSKLRGTAMDHILLPLQVLLCPTWGKIGLGSVKAAPMLGARQTWLESLALRCWDE